MRAIDKHCTIKDLERANELMEYLIKIQGTTYEEKYVHPSNRNTIRIEEFGKIRIPFAKDTESQYIYVHAGHCSQVHSTRPNVPSPRIKWNALVSHPFFCTLTYNNEHLPKITTSSGYDPYICSIQRFTKHVSNDTKL